MKKFRTFLYACCKLLIGAYIAKSQRQINPNPKEPSAQSSEVGWQSVMTPQGLLVYLNPNSDFRIERLVLAKSSVLGEEKYVAFKNVFANQQFLKNLEMNQLFSVMSEVPKGVTFDEHLFEMDGWVCDFSFDQERPPESRPILIFKFDSHDSVFDCIERTSNEVASDFHTSSDIEAVKAHMGQLRAKMEADNERRFVTHYNLLSDPNWIGVVGINLKIGVEDLPSDLHWLTPGISMDQMRWDYVCLAVRPSPNLEEGPVISAFGLLDYEAPQGAEPAGESEATYLPRQLQVGFNNSRIKQYRATLEIGPLEAQTPGEANAEAITISGTVQRHGDRQSYPFGEGAQRLHVQGLKEQFEAKKNAGERASGGN